MSKDLDTFFYVEETYRSKLENLLPEGNIDVVESEFNTFNEKHKIYWSSPFKKIPTRQLIELAQKIRMSETGSIYYWHHALLDLLEDERKTRTIMILDKLRE
jgi:hypothetical protein